MSRWAELNGEVSGAPVSSPASGITESPAGHQDPPIPVSDGYQPGLIDLDAAVQRLRSAYRGGNAHFVNLAKAEKLLAVALGSVPLTNENVAQLWLAIGYQFKELKGDRSLNASDVLPAELRWAQTAICTYANTRGVAIRTPAVFTVLDDLAFRF